MNSKHVMWILCKHRIKLGETNMVSTTLRFMKWIKIILYLRLRYCKFGGHRYTLSGLVSTGKDWFSVWRWVTDEQCKMFYTHLWLSTRVRMWLSLYELCEIVKIQCVYTYFFGRKKLLLRTKCIQVLLGFCFLSLKPTQCIYFISFSP